MYGSRFGDHFAQDRADLHREEFAMFIAMFDALRQTHIGGNYQCRASTPPRMDGLTIGLGEDCWGAPPAITAPRQSTTMRASHPQSHGSPRQGRADASPRPRFHLADCS